MNQKPPQAYEDFIKRYPKLGAAWDLLREGSRDAGSLDDRTIALIKLGVAIGAQRQGATHSAVRKAVRAGIGQTEIEQVVALAASPIGLPAAVAAFTWIQDVVRPSE